MLKLDKNLSHISQRKDSEKSFCYWYDEQEQKLLKGYIFLRQKSQTTTNNSLHSWPLSPLPLFNNKKKWQTSKYNLYFYCCCIFDPLVTCLSVSEIKCFLERWKYIFIMLLFSFLNNGPKASPFLLNKTGFSLLRNKLNLTFMYSPGGDRCPGLTKWHHHLVLNKL